MKPDLRLIISFLDGEGSWVALFAICTTFSLVINPAFISLVLVIGVGLLVFLHR